jgi:Glucodextranase, domain B/PASTA domain
LAYPAGGWLKLWRVRLWSVAAVVVAVSLAGCGGATRTAPPPPVRLSVAGPADGATTLAGQVLVRGTVRPAGATVLVAGQRAAVSGGSFTTAVALRPGLNLIDVLAGAPRAHAAMSALRVYRELPVAVPSLDGRSVSAATDALAQLGLRPRVYDTGGFFQSLLPLSKQVCGTEPGAGSLLAPGTVVQVQIAKVC